MSYQFSGIVQNGNGPLTWTSSDPSAVTVDATGKATAIAQVGSATITASAPGALAATGNVVLAQPAPSTVLISSSDVVSVTQNQATLKNNGVTSALKPNNIVVSGDKGGLLATVVSVQVAGDKVIIQTVPVSLPEAFQQLSVNITSAPQEVTFSFSRQSVVMQNRWGRQVRALPTGAFKCKDKSGNQLDISASFAGGSVTATVQATPILHSHLNLPSLIPVIDEFSYITTVTVMSEITPASLDVRGALKASVTCELKLPPVPILAVSILAVTLAGSADVTAGMSGNLSVGGDVSIATPRFRRQDVIKVGLRYINGSFSQLATDTPTGSADELVWNIAPGADVQGDIGPFVTVEPVLTGFFVWAPIFQVKFAKVTASGKFTFNVPITSKPGFPGYTGPTWSDSLGIDAGLEADVSGGALQPLLDRLHVRPIQAEFSLFSLDVPLAKNPTVTIEATPSVVTSGSAQFVSHVQCTAPICLGHSGNTVKFFGFKDGGTGTQLAQATVANQETASASWQPSAAQNGSYRVAAYLYGGIFGALDLPYASDPNQKASLRVNVAQSGPTPTPPGPTPSPPGPTPSPPGPTPSPPGPTPSPPGPTPTTPGPTPSPPGPTGAPLVFASLTAPDGSTSVTASSVGYQPTLTAQGSGFNNVVSVTFDQRGAATFHKVWNKNDADWNEKLTLNSDTSMTLRPVVTQTGDGSGVSTWTVTLTNAANITMQRTFTLTYTAPLTFTSLTAPDGTSSVTTSTVGFQPTLTARGTGFNDVISVTFDQRGAATFHKVWNKGDADWNEKLTLNGDTSMTLRPVVTGSNDAGGASTWTVTLTNFSNVAMQRSFTLNYIH